MTAPRVTVFTSTVYPDLARVWHACVARSFPRDEALLEIFDDSEGALDPALVPGATVLRRSDARRDFHEAYNDALRRCETPWLAFVDTDVFWIGTGLWARVAAELARPEVAAVSCVSRSVTESHGTFAVVMKCDRYRAALARLPEGFFPAIDDPDPAAPADSWRRHDTGDRMTRAVVAAGGEVRLLNLEGTGDVVRFDGITLTRRAAGWLGAEAFARVSKGSDYFWHGYLGNVVLQKLHDRLFDAGPRYAFPFSAATALRLALARGGGRRRDRVRYALEKRAGARLIERLVLDRPSRTA